MRLSDASSEACEKLVNVRVMPTDALVSENENTSVPKKSSSTVAAAWLNVGVGTRVARVIGRVGQRHPVGVRAVVLDCPDRER